MASSSIEELVLIELTHWVARVAQYSADHPACRAMGEKVHATLTSALAGGPLAFGVLKEDIVVGETRFTHPVVRNRLAPMLHERGILLLRFSNGVTPRELADFVEIITASPQSIYDRGGVLRLMLARGIVRIEIDELEHEVTAEEREAQRLRAKMRDFFHETLRNLLARRAAGALVGEHLRALLEHPTIAVALLEEDPVGIAEAAAGLALMVQQEQERSAEELAPKLRAIMLAFSPPSRARMLLGFPSLAGEFRAALGWSFEGFTESELAGIAFAALRARPEELDVVLYALAAAVPRDLRRRATLRRAALALFDLPGDEPSSALLTSLARPFGEYESFAEEHETLRAQAVRVIAARSIGALGPPAPVVAASRPPASLGGRRAVARTIRSAAAVGALDRVCRTLPAAATALAESGNHNAVVGIVLGLNEVVASDTKGVAAAALRTIGASSATAGLLDELEGAITSLTGEELDELMAAAKLLVVFSPSAALDRLDRSSNRKVRRLLLDGLASGGANLRPLLVGRLRSASWFVVRNAVLLLSRAGGTAADLVAVSHHSNEKVRVEVVRALRLIAPEVAAMEIAARYLSDSSQEVREVALGVLRADLLGDDAIATLAALPGDDQQPEAVRRRVVELLGQSSRDAAAAALVELLQPKNLIERGGAAMIRDIAAEALHGSRAPSAAKFFAEALRSSSGRVRHACERVATRNK